MGRIMHMPRFFRLRQSLAGPTLRDIPGAVRRELAALDLAEQIGPGQSVAITAGSRGIANISLILRTVVDHLKEIGAEPFLVPAMGSHGGGTTEGQLAVLERYGITPASMGCAIRSSMETVVIGETVDAMPIHIDRHAHEADHVFIVNRVKPHTRFTGELESGLHKMMLIGLGKREGAQLYHRVIADRGFDEIVRAVAERVLVDCRIAGGLGIVENGYDETALVSGVRPADFGQVERELLRQARQWLPGLPFGACDLLIVDTIGKDISGSGMDTNVVGRKYDDKKSTPNDRSQVKRIFVRGLTEATAGNATGIGLADFTNDRTVAGIDRRVTAVNCITGAHPTAASIPISFATDRESIEAALMTIGLIEPEEAKILWIANTLAVEEVWASAAYLEDARRNPDLTVLGELEPLSFDASGNLREARLGSPIH